MSGEDNYEELISTVRNQLKIIIKSFMPSFQIFQTRATKSASDT